ncbi:hypothetical protein BHE74_00023748 [Ensete ventricosum]|nr:hypothetical protein BHE74_00023748 [Ensete ventricosum]
MVVLLKIFFGSRIVVSLYKDVPIPFWHGRILCYARWHALMLINIDQKLNLFGPANPFFLGISITECLDLVKGAIDRAGYNGRIKMAIDVGATDFCIGKCNARNLNILQVVGDDLLMSNPKRIERAVNEYTCNALLLKVAC